MVSSLLNFTSLWCFHLFYKLGTFIDPACLHKQVPVKSGGECLVEWYWNLPVWNSKKPWAKVGIDGDPAWTWVPWLPVRCSYHTLVLSYWSSGLEQRLRCTASIDTVQFPHWHGMTISCIFSEYDYWAFPRCIWQSLQGKNPSVLCRWSFSKLLACCYQDTEA